MSIASELTNLSTNITNAYDAINTKGGTIPANKNTANLATAINSISGGGSASVVNGIIANFKASTSTVDANTFVEFVNSITSGTNTKLLTETDRGTYISAVALDSTRVFIAHSSSSSARLSAMVCTISGSTITAGTDVQLSSVSNSANSLCATLIETDKVFIAHRNGSYLYGLICTISGTTITAGTDTQLSSGLSSYQYASVVKLDSTRVFIAHRNNEDLYGLVCAISGTSITAGTDTKLLTNGYKYISAILTDTDRVFVAHQSRQGSYLSAMVCTVSGNTVTAGTDTQLSSVTNSAMSSSLALLDAGRVFIAHACTINSTYYFFGTVCTVNGATITAGTDIQLSESTVGNQVFATNAVRLAANKVFASICGISESFVATCLVVDKTVTKVSKKLVGAYGAMSSTLSDTDKIFLSYGYDSSNKYLYGIVYDISDITIKEPSMVIQGLTKTACTTSTAGEVWVLST